MSGGGRKRHAVLEAHAAGAASAQLSFLPRKSHWRSAQFPFRGGSETRRPHLLQAKLVIGSSGDVFEREAEDVAEQVARTADAVTQFPATAPPGSPRLQAKPLVQAGVPKGAGNCAVTALVGEVLRSPGRPLDSVTRAFMESRFRYDFGKVRVHADDLAAKSAQALQARAFTVMTDIVFAEGAFAPTSGPGKTLLAHELTHVIQQERGRLRESGVVQRWGASEHRRLTRSCTNELLGHYPGFDRDDTAVSALSECSADMDNKIAELWFNVGSVGRKIPIVGAVFGPPGQSISEYYARHPNNALNHGEGGLYRYSERESARRNIERQQSYEAQAREAFEGLPRTFGSITESETTKPKIRRTVLSILGDALHVAQDRGAHWEGQSGMGHAAPDFDPDDPSANSEGAARARRNTELVLLRAIDLLYKLLHRDFVTKHAAVFPSEARTRAPRSAEAP